ncbi:hypothetical protein [Bilifractor sp. HCP3S3_D3]|uniref:hypothetical protein n=1 Tax=Bilifractor sp. HCP3S3_D3 TaxID=3438907 RepID=UPI003F8B898F
MPHSTGGGGSHGGSFSGGGGSFRGTSSSRDTNTVHYYTHYRPGAHVWVLYCNGMPHYRYTDAAYRGGNSPLSFLVAVIVLVMIGFFFVTFGAVPARVTSGQTPLTIQDNAKIFSEKDTEKLEEAVDAYYDKSGIPVVIQTVDYKTWYAYYGSWGQTQENYAYDSYVSMFPTDEKHWLICVWSGEGKQGTDEVDSNAYTFAGVAGDDTSNMLPESMTQTFNSTVSRQLGQNMHQEGACADALVKGFQTIGTPKANIVFLLVGYGCFAMAALVVVLCILAIRKDKRTPAGQKMHEVNTHGEAPRLVRCDYCGGTYVFGETVCPHCNAPGKTAYDGSSEQEVARG